MPDPSAGGEPSRSARPILEAIKARAPRQSRDPRGISRPDRTRRQGTRRETRVGDGQARHPGIGRPPRLCQPRALLVAEPRQPRGAYIRRDGDTNPEIESDRFDRGALSRMTREADTLALAYYYSDDPRYAEGAARVIRRWFLDPATAMNPNMNHAQAVPGVSNGRPEGVLDGASFIAVIDAAGLIAPSGALSPAETAALEAWFARYVDWMLESPNGKEEAARVQQSRPVVRCAGRALRAVRAQTRCRTKDRAGLPQGPPRTAGRRFGRAPRRTRPHAQLSLFALRAGRRLHARRQRGVPRHRPLSCRGKGRSLRKATDHVAAYRGRAADWPYREMNWPADTLDALLVRADAAWGPGPIPAPSATTCCCATACPRVTG